MGEGIKKNKKSGDGRNKYLKERLPSQLHRAEMWKRQSKQARSLGWLGGVVGETKRENASMKQNQEMEQEQAEAETEKEKGGGEEGNNELETKGPQNNRR